MRHIQYISICAIFFTYFVAKTDSTSNCTAFEHTLRHQNKISHAEIVCSDVPPSLLINTYHFSDKPYPQYLIISESTISTVPNYSSLLNMRFIRKLIMKNLGIKVIRAGAFRNMEILEELDLSYNQLTNITDGAFSGLVNLRRLYLRQNNIAVEPQNVFQDLPNLEYLDFSDNPIKEIKPELFANKNVKINILSNMP